MAKLLKREVERKEMDEKECKEKEKNAWVVGFILGSVLTGGTALLLGVVI